MLALEDYLDALRWAESIGGLQALIDRSNANFGVIALSRYRFVTTEVGPIVCPADHWSEENLQVQLLYVGSV